MPPQNTTTGPHFLDNNFDLLVYSVYAPRIHLNLITVLVGKHINKKYWGTFNDRCFKQQPRTETQHTPPYQTAPPAEQLKLSSTVRQGVMATSFQAAGTEITFNYRAWDASKWPH